MTRTRSFVRARRWLAAAAVAGAAATGFARNASAQAAADLPTTCSGNAEATTVAGFATRLERLKRDVSTAAAPAVAARLAGDLPACWRVRSNGRELVADTTWLRRALGAPTADAKWADRRTALAVQVTTLRAEALAWKSAADAEATAARQDPHAALRAVLAQPEFQRANRTGWADALTERLQTWLRRVLGGLAGRALPTHTVAAVIAWTVGIGAFVLLAVWLWRLRRLRPDPMQLAMVAPRRSSNDWAALAREALGRGDAREAVRCAYHAALFRGEEQGVWRVDPARTPREYIRLLPATAERRSVGEIAREFERVWFAHQTPDARQLLVHLEGIGCRPHPDATI